MGCCGSKNPREAIFDGDVNPNKVIEIIFDDYKPENGRDCKYFRDIDTKGFKCKLNGPRITFTYMNHVVGKDNKHLHKYSEVKFTKDIEGINTYLIYPNVVACDIDRRMQILDEDGKPIYTLGFRIDRDANRYTYKTRLIVKKHEIVNHITNSYNRYDNPLILEDNTLLGDDIDQINITGPRILNNYDDQKTINTNQGDDGTLGQLLISLV